MKKSNKSDRQRYPHFPFEDPPFRLSKGLVNIPESEWFEIFDLQERALQLAEKKRLLANYHDDVFISDPSAIMASKEVFNLMLEHLPAVRPELYALGKDSIKLEPHTMYEGDEWSTALKKNKMHPLDLAARLVQEDLIIMLPAEEKRPGWWLAAGSVAFPSRWNLKEKFGKTMDVIHSPVPFYKEQLQVSTNDFFDRMPINEIFSRRNWSIHNNPSLRQDGTENTSEKPSNKITSVNAGENLWLRVERQTLRKLKETDAILFTIRIHLRPLKEVVKFKGIVYRLTRALSTLPPEMQTYKQTNIFADSVQNYLNKF
jgi:dimethylamine monooxygenase subunit A